MHGIWVNIFLFSFIPLVTACHHHYRQDEIYLPGFGHIRGTFDQKCHSDDDCVSLCHEPDCIWLEPAYARYMNRDLNQYMFLTQNRRRYRYDDANERGRKDGQFTAYGTGVCKDNACHRKCTPRCPHFEFCRASDGLCSPPQSDGAACAKDTECLSFCVDGVCKGRELGAPCQNRMECDSRFCWDGECRRDDLEVGDKCDVHWVCASRACHNGTCKPGNLKDYEQCYIPEQCASRYCPGECRPLAVDAGGKCHAGMQCKSKLCLDGTCGRTKVDNGGTCRDDRECARYRCIYGKCAAERVSLGGRCTLDSECESGYCNEHNKCAVSTGQPCKSKDDCRGRGETYCSSSTKKCGHSRLHGQYCSTTEQCLRGLCCVGGKCDNCPGKEFAACSRHSDCEAGLSCFQSVEFPERKQCGPPDGRLRSPCSAKHPCRGSLQCRGGQCLPERWSPKDGDPLSYIVRPVSLAICKTACAIDYDSKDCQACIAQGEVHR